jgi:arginine deiminase
MQYSDETSTGTQAGKEAKRTAPLPLPGCGVYSEVGRLRSVLVCRPGLAHSRLTPRICRELSFDAPLWVERAQADFAQFVRELTQRGVEVLELHDLLAQTLADPAARAWLLDRLLVADALGVDSPGELRQACAELGAARLAELMIGGMTVADLGLPASGSLGAALALHSFVLPPLPRSLLVREANSWIQRGVLLSPGGARAASSEALLIGAVYRFHPRFSASGVRVWWGDADAPAPRANAEGRDIMLMGQGVVLVGVGDRTQSQAVVQIARALFDGGAAHAVIAAQLPCGGVPLDRAFTQCAPDVVTYRPDVIDRVTCQELRPAPHAAAGIQVQAHPGEHLLDVLSEALRTPTFNAIAAGPGVAGAALAPWDDGTGVLAIEPGVVVGYDRNTRTNRRLRDAGVEVIEVPGGELGRVGAGTHALGCPLERDAVSYRVL